jgi:hypothetical protein
MEVECWRCGVAFDPDINAGRCPGCGYNVRTPLARARLVVARNLPTWRQAPQRAIKLVAAGGASFWLPDTLCHAIRRSDFGEIDVLAMTILMPLTLLATYLVIKRRPVSEGQRNAGLLLMLGVWMLGGFFIAVGGLLGGGYDSRPESFQSALFVTLIGFVPPSTYILAAYDGSLGALIFTTLGSLVFVARGRWQKRQLQN